MNLFATIALPLSLVSSQTLAIDNLLPIRFGKGVKSGHSYTVYVTNENDAHRAGPYTFKISDRKFVMRTRAETQARRFIKICVHPEGNSRSLVSGKLVLKNRKYYKLEADENGVICTPRTVNVDVAEVGYIEVSAR